VISKGRDDDLALCISPVGTRVFDLRERRPLSSPNQKESTEMSLDENAREQLLSSGSWAVDPARIDSFPLTGTGEPVTGPESWLYPLSPPS
jgi:hypothetical protein